MSGGVHDMVWECKDEKANIISFLSGNLAFSASLFGPFVTATIPQVLFVLIRDLKTSPSAFPLVILDAPTSGLVYFMPGRIILNNYVPHVEDLP